MILMEKGGFSTELLKVTLSQCTEDEVITAQEKLTSLEAERKMTEEKKPEMFWLQDINKFTTRYCKHYKCEYTSPSNIEHQESGEENEEKEIGEENEEAENEEKENEENGDEENEEKEGEVEEDQNEEGENCNEDKDEEQ